MMKAKKSLSSVLFVGLILVLASSIGPTTVRGQKPPDGLAAQAQAVGTAFTYQGRLTDGGNPANGEYDFRFRLYDAATSGVQVGSTVFQVNTSVTNGLFTVELDFGSGIFTGEALYLAIAVRPGDSTGAYTALLPRQLLAPTPYALSLRPGAQVISEESGGDAVYGETTATSGTGMVGKASATSGNTFGVRGVNNSSGGTGVYGYAGSSTSGTDGRPYGVSGYSSSGHGVYGSTLGDWNWRSGVYGEAANNHANGVTGWNTGGGVGVYAWSETGIGLVAKSGGSNIIEAYTTDPTDNRRWYVRNDGQVFADGSFHNTGADFAEMLPAVDELEPGDVLVIGSDGLLHRSSGPSAANVVGVYSTQPGFIGGSDEEMENPGEVPLAVVGVVPVKASAENGSIAPGDLLTTSSMPGHAMKAGSDPTVGTVIGKALGPLEEGTGVIQMLVTHQ
jgi:hypothetical protein